MLAVMSMLGIGCARAIEGHPVAASARAGSSDESQCTKVDAPLTSVPASPGAPSDAEPMMKVPQPAGWDRVTDLDSAMIRFTMGNKELGVADFAASAVVTIESHPGELDPDEFFQGARDALKSSFDTAEPDYTDGTVCGLPSETIKYVIPQMGALKREVAATALMVVVFTGRKTYGVVLTIQSPKPDDAGYQHDEKTILDGFQVLAPDSGHR